MILFQSLTLEDLTELLLPISQAPFKAKQKADDLDEKKIQLKTTARARMRAKQIFVWVYQRHVFNFDQMTDLSKDLRSWLKENIEIYRLKETVNQQALDGTHKFLWQLKDSKTIESVIIPAALTDAQDAQEDETQNEPYQEPSLTAPQASIWAGKPAQAPLALEHWKRLTVCISSQVGCAMACKFCLTGVQGLDRHLEVHEIVAQVHELRMKAPITNIVFMGMGEPLHNVQNVAKACKILLTPEGLAFSKRKITVSTSGLVPGIDELGKQVDVSLAISLNASYDDQRSEIMPVNKRWNLKELLDACKRYPLGKHRRITFEYVLLRGINDTSEDAYRVIKLLRQIPSKVNLIPFNEHSGSVYKRPDDIQVKNFQKILLDNGYTATVRISRGRDILAACGQLRSLFGTARGTEKHKDYSPAVL